MAFTLQMAPICAIRLNVLHAPMYCMPPCAACVPSGQERALDKAFRREITGARDDGMWEVAQRIYKDRKRPPSGLAQRSLEDVLAKLPEAGAAQQPSPPSPLSSLQSLGVPNPLILWNKDRCRAGSALACNYKCTSQSSCICAACLPVHPCAHHPLRAMTNFLMPTGHCKHVVCMFCPAPLAAKNRGTILSGDLLPRPAYLEGQEQSHTGVRHQGL